MFESVAFLNVLTSNDTQLIEGVTNPDILIEINSNETFQDGDLIQRSYKSGNVFKVRWVQEGITGNLVSMGYGSTELLLDIPSPLTPFNLEIIPGRYQFAYSVRISKRVFNPIYNGLAQKLGISLSLLNSIPQQTLQVLNGINLGLSTELNEISELVGLPTSEGAPNTLVMRDLNGNFEAGLINASVLGTSGNSAKLNNQSSDFYQSRVNHTGVQSSNSISDFDERVQLSSLNQMAASTASVSFNNQKITNLALPQSNSDGVNKSYADSISDKPIGTLGAGVSVRGYRPIVLATASKTLALSDANTCQICSGSAVITIPSNSSVPFPIGTEILLQRRTATTITIAVASGVGITGEIGTALTLTTVHNSTLLKKTLADTWIAINPIPNNAVLPGTPTTTTQPAGTNSEAVATTEFVNAAVETAILKTAVLSVYAQQNSAILLTSGTPTLVPFPLEIIDVSNQFSSGAFIPLLPGEYRYTVNFRFGDTTGLTVYRAALFEGVTEIATIMLKTCPSATAVIDSGSNTVRLTAGLSYTIRVTVTGASPSIPVASNIKNTLTIERFV